MRAFHREKPLRARPKTQVVVRRPRRLWARRGFGLHAPILIAAFEGWNDAAESASQASRYLESAWSAQPLGEIDGEEFFDFTDVRPETLIEANGERQIVWPSTALFVARDPEGAHDIVLLRAPEPQLRWRTYCDVVLDCVQRFEIERVVTLGAYLSEVTHRRPVAVHVSNSPVRVETTDSPSSSPYEGPTGIVGVLGAALSAAGIDNSSVWASVPCYSLPVSHKAALALVEATAQLVDRSVDTAGLEAEAHEYETRMNELVEEDENIATYVARIEEMEDTAGREVSADVLADEIERYLRGRRSG